MRDRLSQAKSAVKMRKQFRHYCQYCGKKIDSSFKYCPSCGKQILHDIDKRNNLYTFGVCSVCHEPFAEIAKFCQYCGKKWESERDFIDMDTWYLDEIKLKFDVCAQSEESVKFIEYENNVVGYDSILGGLSIPRDLLLRMDWHILDPASLNVTISLASDTISDIALPDWDADIDETD